MRHTCACSCSARLLSCSLLLPQDAFSKASTNGFDQSTNLFWQLTLDESFSSNGFLVTGLRMVKESGWDHPVAEAKLQFKLGGQSRPTVDATIEARPVKNCRKISRCETLNDEGEVVAIASCVKDSCPPSNADGYFGAMISVKASGLAFSQDFFGVEGLRQPYDLTVVRHFTKTVGSPANAPIRTEMSGETTSFYEIGIVSTRKHPIAMTVDELRQLEANVLGCDDPNEPTESVFQFPLSSVTIDYATSSGEMPVELDGNYNPFLLCPRGMQDLECELRGVPRGGIWLKGIAAMGSDLSTTLSAGQRMLICSTLNLVDEGECPDPIVDIEVAVYLDPADRGTCQHSYFQLSHSVISRCETLNGEGAVEAIAGCTPKELPRLIFGQPPAWNEGASVDYGSGPPFYVNRGMKHVMFGLTDKMDLAARLKMPHGFAITQLGLTEAPDDRRRRRQLLAKERSFKRVAVTLHARQLSDEEEETPFTYGEAVFDDEFLEGASLTRIDTKTTFRRDLSDMTIRAGVSLLE